MVLEPDVLDFVKDESVMFEQEPMEKIAESGEMVCFKHLGFWQCMDTLRDKQMLESLWAEKKAPWKLWN